MNELLYYDLKQKLGMPPSLSTQVARELGRRIVSGFYEQGALIDDETTLTKRYQVSKVVIRDAVKILVSKGLLDVRRGIGTKVRTRDNWIVWDDDVLAWHMSSPFNKDFLQKLMDIRLVFEPKASRWAAERATEEDILEIEKACLAMESDQASVEDYIIADASFHRAVLHAARNEFLKAMEGVIYSALLISIRKTNHDPRNNPDSIRYHRSVYGAILQRDGDLAENLTLTLLNDAQVRLSKID